jgi:hypothetical protein
MGTNILNLTVWYTRVSYMSLAWKGHRKTSWDAKVTYINQLCTVEWQACAIVEVYEETVMAVSNCGSEVLCTRLAHLPHCCVYTSDDP